jgi:hypothetical protein
MKKAILVATIGAMSLGLQAGEWGKAVIPSKSPIVDCIDVGGQISAGYKTDYILFGARLARDTVWTDVNYTFDNLALPVTFGATYLNGITPTNFDELDLYTNVGLGNYAGFDVELGYIHRFFPEANSGGSWGEIVLGVRRDLGIVDFVASTRYDVTFRGWYHQFGLERSFGLTDNVSLVLAGGVGYDDNFWRLGFPNQTSGWNHYYITASLPIALNCRATITPYIGYVGKGGMIADDYIGIAGGNDTSQPDILHGGVSLSVSF